MAFPESFLENFLTAALSGGGSAATAIIAFFRDIKGRLTKIEDKIGSLEGRSGLIYAVNQLELGITALRSDLNGLSQHPPEWLVALVQRIARRSPVFGDPVDFADFDVQTVKSLARRLKDLEEKQEDLARKVAKCVSEEDFDDADRARAEDIATIRTTIAEVNGLLKGLQSALGLIKGGHGGEYRR